MTDTQTPTPVPLDPTLAAYAAHAKEFVDEWMNQPTPTDLQADLKQWFVPAGITADIGSGSGREVAWLSEQGWPSVGYDASPELLALAQARFPKLDLRSSHLPELAEIRDGSYDNVLCETVLMHLPVGVVPAAVRSLLRILRPAGVLYLSWRVSEAGDFDDERGRHYTSFPASLVTDALSDADVLHQEERTSQSSGKKIAIVVARKRAAAEGA